MENYQLIKEVGKGSFGRVYQALNKRNGEVVAIKKIVNQKFSSWEECINLREVKSLRKLNNHPNIIKLKELIRESDTLFFVFELMDLNLHELMAIRNRKAGFTEREVKKYCVQVFRGLAYMHQRGYFHRDLKPENLLISQDDVIKIADLGLAREIDSQPPCTDYVATRWYRAPEMLLCSPSYGPAVDMWAMGAIMAELFNLSPLFPGLNDADEVYRICSVIGSPSERDWPQGHDLAASLNYQFPEVSGVDLSALIPTASADAVSLIRSLCSWDPAKRPTAEEVLKHPFFQSRPYVPPSLRYRGAMEQKKNGGDEDELRYLMKSSLCEGYGKLCVKPQQPHLYLGPSWTVLPRKVAG